MYTKFETITNCFKTILAISSTRIHYSKINVRMYITSMCFGRLTLIIPDVCRRNLAAATYFI